MDEPLARAFIEQLRDWPDFEPAKMFCPEMIKDVLLAAAEIEQLRAALRDLLDAYLADVNPNDRNQAAIEHARRNIE